MQVVVMGMPRSGTSLVASLLHAMGVNMGDRMFAADEFNPMGYYEDRDFVDLNGSVLRRGGYRWSRPPTEEHRLELIQMYRTAAEELVAHKDKGLWGFKDPRTVLLWDMYHPFLTEPHYVVVERKGAAVMSSLESRAKKCADEMRVSICDGEPAPIDWRDWLSEGAWERGKWGLLCKEYAAALERQDEECDAPRIDLRFEALTNKHTAAKHVKRLADFIGYTGEIMPACGRISFRN